jgi:hypothetical protein
MRRLSLLGLMILASACASTPDPQEKIEYYQPAYRQLPSEPAYSRMTWSHLPSPVPLAAAEKGPYFLPVMRAEFSETTLGEAVQVLAKTIGYRADSPAAVAGRKISVRFSGTLDEILVEVSKQGGVYAQLDHEAKVIRIGDPAAAATSP